MKDTKLQRLLRNEVSVGSKNEDKPTWKSSYTFFSSSKVFSIHNWEVSRTSWILYLLQVDIL